MKAQIILSRAFTLHLLPALLLLSFAGHASAQVAREATDPAAETQSAAPPPPDHEGVVTGMTPPVYPPEALKKGIGGLVLLAVEITNKGEVMLVTVQESSLNEHLDKAAVSAAWGWRFNPGMRDGVHVGGTVLVPVNFIPPFESNH